jgi:hypothetical protein
VISSEVPQCGENPAVLKKKKPLGNVIGETMDVTLTVVPVVGKVPIFSLVSRLPHPWPGGELGM